MIGRILLGCAGAALVLALGWALASAEATSRGSDELVYAQFGQLPFAPGTSYEQPLRIQAGGLSRLSIPYHFEGGGPARVRIAVSEPAGGRVLLDSVRDAPSTTTILGSLLPLGSDYWDSQQSGWLRVEVPAPSRQAELEVRLQRLDEGAGNFFFYTDPALATRKAALIQNPDIAIVIQTSYGPLQPGVLKAPIYAQRVTRLAPPWLRGPIPELLVALLLLSGLAAAALCFQGPAAEGPGPSSKLGDRNGDL